MSDLKYPLRLFTVQDARKIAEDVFGIQGTIKKLPGELDQNFYLKTEDNREYKLKIAHPGESREILDMQNQTMKFLGQVSSEPICPRVFRSKSGSEISLIEGRDGKNYLACLYSYLKGTPLAEFRPHTPKLLESIGTFMGKMDDHLKKFTHNGARRSLVWDLSQAGFLQSHLGDIPAGKKRALVKHFLQFYKKKVIPSSLKIRRSVIQNDGNDHNILIQETWPDGPRVSGIVDFGDMVYTHTVNEIAITAAYALMHKDDPLSAAFCLVRGYNLGMPLKEKEIELIYPLICIRLCISVTMSEIRKKKEPGISYLTISERPAWRLLEQLSRINENVFHYTMRQACGKHACPRTPPLVSWLKKNRNQIGSILKDGWDRKKTKILDLSISSSALTNLEFLIRSRNHTDAVRKIMETDHGSTGIARYMEPRLWESLNPLRKKNWGKKRPNIHLGIDLFVPAGSPIYAPLKGVVHGRKYRNFSNTDFGPSLILEHEIPITSQKFYTLYGGLSKKSLLELPAGKKIKKGEIIGVTGDSDENGGYFPHIHFQLISDLLDDKGQFPGMVYSGVEKIWKSISPDPNLILKIPHGFFPEKSPEPADISKQRTLVLGKSLSLSYRSHLHIVRGFMQYLIGSQGHLYLDAVNNVPHVGHSHPVVAKAAAKQSLVLNTNTRYLHQNIIRYSRELTKTLPSPLRVCFFVNSGSEANELALRLARTHTRKQDIIVVDHAYHGNTTAVIEISPYKHDGPGGEGAKTYIHKVMMPDVFRGPFRTNDPRAGEKYARDIYRVLEQMAKKKIKPAAFIHESLPGVGGQIILPAGYLKAAYGFVREAGGICIADEVQVGFGRVGTRFWAFQLQGVVPDILTLGKPIGNGHPLGAVVTTQEIADSFDNGMEYFNTFGGNPVSCQVGLSVLEVIKKGRLQENARKVGQFFIKRLLSLKKKYPLIGDIRGIGLFIGIELVLNRQTLEPAPDQAAYLIERMKDRDILLSTDGPFHNIIKIKPPLAFNRANADLVVETLNEILQENFCRLD